MRKGLAAITDWRIGGWFAAIWPSVLLGVAVSVLTLLSTRADAQLPGSAATGNQFNTMPQEVQTVLVDARQTYRDALSGDPCDPKIRAYMAIHVMVHVAASEAVLAWLPAIKVTATPTAS